MMLTPPFILAARRTIAVCLFLQFLLSWELWTATTRDFPFVPLISFFPSDALSFLVLPAFLVASIGLMLLIFQPHRSMGLWCLLLPLGWLLLHDSTRLQVWLYHQVGLLILLFVGKERTCFWPRLAITMLYFWSGFHKLNVYFIEDTFPWFMEQAGPFSFLGAHSWAAILVAVFEMSIGAALVWKRTRPWAAVLGIGFHFIILYLLSPLGHHWNEVVWPWNLAMIILLYLLFLRDQEEKTLLNPLPELKANSFYFFSLLLLLLPGLNAFRLWDEQLSFKMYAGTNPEGVFYFDERDQSCFEAAPIAHRSPSLSGPIMLRFIFDDFAFQELKVPPYASERSLKQIAQYFCQCLQYPQHGGVEILWVDPWNKDQTEFKDYPCSLLMRTNKNESSTLNHGGTLEEMD
ncbi:MAG: MauE/DoxX family redox-associated membrane protein [Bacteroidota bacterium]